MARYYSHLMAGPQLYREVRAAFIRRGTTLASYCRDINVAKQHARASLLGEWRGPKASQLVERICKAASLTR